MLLAASASAATNAQPSFPTPDQAVETLVAAVRAGDPAAIAKILGPGSAKLVSSGDPVADQNTRERFLAEVADGSKIVKRDEDHAILIIGKDEWPFPIPAVMKDGAWRFDSRAGQQEIIDRRIGANELDAIQVALAYADAQREYATQDRNHDGFVEYAQKIMSDPGKHDGLYWPADPVAGESPMGPLMASARAEGYKPAKGQRAPYHGYYYKILTGQGEHASGGALDYVVKGHMIGGFALVAFPAEYGSSGIMTFIVNHDDVVYQKDLGPGTAAIASRMTRFDPGPGWAEVKQ
jgi:hypothetical protein